MAHATSFKVHDSCAELLEVKAADLQRKHAKRDLVKHVAVRAQLQHKAKLIAMPHKFTKKKLGYVFAGPRPFLRQASHQVSHHKQFSVSFVFVLK